MNLYTFKEDFHNIRFYSITTLLFVVLSIIFLFIPDATRIYSSTDPIEYINSAESLIFCKSFAYKEIGCLPKTWNTPGYPIFIAGHMLLFENFILYLIISQNILLIITAYFSKKIFDTYNSKYSKWVFALVLYNPNSFSTAQLIQTETLFTFFLVISLYIMYFAVSKRGYFFLGIFFAICAFVRPAFYYFCILSPIIFYLYLRYISDLNIRKCLINASLGGTICLSLVSLWTLRNNNNFNVPVFVSNAGFMVWANLEEMNKLNNTGKDINSKYNAIMSEIENLEGYKYGGRQTPLSSKILLENSKEELDISFKFFLVAGFKSLTNLFFSGGGANFERLIKSKDENYKKNNNLYYNYNFSDNIWKEIKNLFTLYSLPIIFSIFIKIFSFFGAIILILRKNYKLLFITLFPIIYLSPLYGFFGQSRFRVPMEPNFTILSVLGILWLYFFLKDKLTENSGAG